MALATRCPACGTIFRITTIQAAAKSGMVRCGACRTVFNSLDALVRVEDLEREPPETQSEQSAAPHRASQDSDALVAALGPPAAVDMNQPAPGNRAQAEIDLPQSALEVPSSQAAAHGLQELVVEPSADTAHDGALDGPPARIGDHRLDLDRPNAESAAAAEPAFMRGASRPVRSAAERAVLVILSLIAVSALVAQAAYVWRDELAARWPLVKPALLAACVPLRCAIALPARLEAIRIVSSSLQNTPANRDIYVATVLLRNYSHVSVQLPAIEMTLTDSLDRPLVRRVFRPGDYLTRDSSAPRGAQTDGIGADSELPVRFVFEASGLRVAGFYFDRFYP